VEVNRQTKRMMQRQGQVAADGSPATARREPRAPRPASTRTSPGQFVREVRAELKRVAWPTRTEVARYSTVVLLTLILLIGLIFVLDFGFSKGILFVFDPVLKK
jgi:preprotein translocase subunit SecE